MVVDKEIRDLWTLDTAARTLDRIERTPGNRICRISLKAKEQIPILIRKNIP